MRHRDRACERWQDRLAAALKATSGAVDADLGSPAWSRIGGNAFASAWSLALGSLRFFVKLTGDANHFMLAAEADALRAIARTAAVRVPRVIANGRTAGVAFLALEWLDIVDGGRDAALGRALDRMHAVTSSRYGWHRDNTIGPTLNLFGASYLVRAEIMVAELLAVR